MLLSPKARSTGIGFLIGWLLGIVVAVVIFTLLSTIIQQGDSEAAKPVAGVIKILLGFGLLLLSVRQWRSRPREGIEPATPKWMDAIDTLTPLRGLALGFALSGLNPKNLLMGVGAGVSIGSAGLDVGQVSVTILIYTIIASVTVAGPVVAFLAASDRMAGPLDALRTWLLHNNATVMTVLLLIIGIVMVGKGIGSF